MVISNRDADALRSVRRIYTELQELRSELKERRVVSLHSPSLDDMPRGSGHADKMLDRMVYIDSMERREAILARKLAAVRAKAYQICRRMSSVKAGMFFEAYCADLQTIETAQKYSGADDQTVLAYRRMLGEVK